MAIIFKSIRWKNLLSTGNVFTELDLNFGKTKLIVGKNGGGKSTFIEALCFVLYNKPYRNINKPQLINSINKKDLLVEINFQVDDTEYFIRRGMVPTIFEIYRDGVMINQDSGARDYQEIVEKQILKLNYKSFCQLIVLGSSNYIPFMQLPPHERRIVVEDLLDIQIFSTMNFLLKNKIATNEDKLKDILHFINLEEEKWKLHKKHLLEMKKKSEEYIKRLRENIETDSEHLINSQNSIESFVEQLKEKTAEMNLLSKSTTKKKQLEKFKVQFEQKVIKIKEELEFFHDNENCPTCNQAIDEAFKCETIEKKQKSLCEIEEGKQKLLDELIKLQVSLDRLAEVQNEISDINLEIASLNTTITQLNKNITKLNSDIEEILDSNPVVTDTTDYEKKLIKLEELKENAIKDKEAYTIVSSILKDTGIKSKIIKQYIPVINKLLNKYLAAMDFFVNFEFNENFKETINSRYRDDFTYASFSEGEKMRINIAILFCWRTIAKMRSGLSTNLLIMDEILDGSLDADANEELLKILNTMTEGSSVFIISHKLDQISDRFQDVIKFEKINNYSRIVSS